MEILLDDLGAEKLFRQIVLRIQQLKNGEVADNMKLHGINYRINWGVPVVDLRRIAGDYSPSHVLALKLWNRPWRETMILATLLDEPSLVSEQQMDFWTKSFENVEIAEQASANLWCRTPFAYVKAMEWCRAKKHWVRYTAVHLTGRLALYDKKSPDEMFETFFEEFVPLTKDPALFSVIYRTMIVLADRSECLRKMVGEWIIRIRLENSDQANDLADEIGKGIRV